MFPEAPSRYACSTAFVAASVIASATSPGSASMCRCANETTSRRTSPMEVGTASSLSSRRSTSARVDVCPKIAAAKLKGRGEPAQRPQARAHEVLAATDGRERRQPAEHDRRLALDDHPPAAVVVVADDRIAVVADAERVAVVDPARLDDLELPLDVRLVALEHEPALDAVVLEDAIRKRLPERAAAADDPVPVRELAAEEAVVIARVRPADVRAGRASHPVTVVRVAEVVHPCRIAGDRRVRAVRGGDQRRP